MLNNTRKASTRNKQTNVVHEEVAESHQQTAEQHDRKDQHDAKLGVAKGILECCRSSRHKVTTCKGSFK